MGSDSDGLDEGVFDPVEDALLVLRLLGDPRCRVELLVQRPLLLGRGARNDDVEVPELVAAALRLEPRHALAAQPHGLAVLRAGGHLDLRPIAFDRRHLELVAERRLCRRDAKHVDEIVALAFEPRVLLEPDEDVEIARWSAAHPGLALARDAKLLAVVDASGDRERDVALLALAALAAAADADLVDGLAGAAAARAGRHVHEAAEHRLLDLTDLALAAAGRAGRHLRAPLGTVAAARLAGLEARDLDDPLATADRVDELELDLHAQVGAAHRAALTAAHLAAEERVEQVVDPEADRSVGAPEHVVALAALGVRQDLVGLGHFLEADGRIVGRVDIRVVLARELPIGAPDVVLGRFLGDLEGRVVIGACHD